MTSQETRQLGIEFERRVQTMIPETEFLNKLDTETIYSYLNQYLDKLIHDLYKAVDQIPTSNSETYIETLLNSMLVSELLEFDEFANSAGGRFRGAQLPNNFGLYVKSFSNVSTSYRYKDLTDNSSGILPNELISVKDVNKVIPRPLDNMRILRNPIVWFTENKRLHVIYDYYTEPINITLEYYRVPNYMNPLTSTDCELPMEMFEPLVSGAVDLYVQYVAGAEARKRLMAEQLRKELKRKDEDE